MSKNNDRLFRKAAVGGFNRDDVVAYLQTAARGHREEMTALQNELDCLRGELEELRAENTELMNNRAAADLTKLAEEGEAHAQEREAMQAELAELRLQLSQTQDELSETRTELAEYRSKWDEIGAESGTIEEYRRRTAELELAALQRVEAIEGQARQSAEALLSDARLKTEQQQSALAQSALELKNRLAAIRHDTGLSSGSFLRELERIRVWAEGADSLFETLESRVGELAGESRPVVRDFVPLEF